MLESGLRKNKKLTDHNGLHSSQ